MKHAASSVPILTVWRKIPATQSEPIATQVTAQVTAEVAGEVAGEVTAQSPTRSSDC